MKIEPMTPFKIEPEEDGTQHAIHDNIQISVLPDFDNVKIKHRNAVKPFSNGQHTRWLYIKVDDIKIYVHGTHVVVSKKELNP